MMAAFLSFCWWRRGRARKADRDGEGVTLSRCLACYVGDGVLRQCYLGESVCSLRLAGCVRGVPGAFALT